MSDFETTRAQLRRYLMPGAPDDLHVSEDQFPRSKVMRFAFNPRNRKVLALSGSMLAVAASRMVGANRLGLVSDLWHSFKRSKR